jgi:hypothetical protein
METNAAIVTCGATLLLMAAPIAHAADRKSKAAAEKKSDPWLEYHKAVSAAQHRFLTSFAATLSEADDAEAFVVTATQDSPEQELFCRNLANVSSYVVQRKPVDAGALANWVQTIQKTLRAAQDNKLGAHIPAYGIRLYKQNPGESGSTSSKRIVFECTVGEGPANFALRLPDGSGTFALPDQALRDLLTAQLGAK